MIKFTDVNYHYKQQSFHFDLEVEAGSVVAILGPSGAGKSTLLNLLVGFITPVQGEIKINNGSILKQAPHQRPLSILFQDNNLFTHLSAYENIALGLHPGLKLNAEQKLRLHTVSEQVGVENLLDRLPAQLSGGQQQRIALARCFVQDKPILLLDEPFSALDPVLRVAMLKSVKSLAKLQNVTVLMVTHHIHDALSVASDFVFIDRGTALAVEKITYLNTTHNNKQLVDFLSAEMNR
ncbi:thiamine ABC transporter ATP-binding protein [Psychromonas sp. SR45-3]|uniref:thiamine ABC transporter ATP-binding protein n=1 Tax=Psychromonas sp. SR45-3 TaxID=2760930 RepID=UPI0015FE7EC0|nr:thiamine ABC transporter ATP-binding protein [Psychromonas sp. SR45-3]MBB1271529.1 thiamine ABC transporter ATP-binding protein [Psychromonas sp. SR45-3]